MINQIKTDEINIIFFEKVKGKKIRWSNWHYGAYMIPLNRKNDILEGEDENGTYLYARINQGFDNCRYGYWEMDLSETERKIKETINEINEIKW